MVDHYKGPWRYVDKFGVERVCTEPGQSGIFSSSLSPEIKDYQDKMKAIMLHGKGLEKKEVAKRLNRGEKWVQKWWKCEPMTLKRPKGAEDADPSEWRDCEFIRGFASNQNIYDKLVARCEWNDARVVARDREDGGRSLTVRYDKDGKELKGRRKIAHYNGEVPELDAVLKRAYQHVEVEDDEYSVIMNWYLHGENVTGNHRHNAWTVLLSFGAPRILQVDLKPFVLFDGDMIIFGQQMHGVPKMPDVGPNDGRISVVFFFHPNKKQLAKQWQTTTEEQDEEAADAAQTAKRDDQPLPLPSIDLDSAPTEELPYDPNMDPNVLAAQLGISWDMAQSLCEDRRRVYLLPDLSSRIVFERMERWQCGTLWDIICRTSHETAAKSRVLYYRTIKKRPSDALQFLCSDQGQSFVGDLVRDAPCAVVCTSPIDGGNDWRRCDLTRFLAEALIQRYVEVRIVNERGEDALFVSDELPF
eukprot:GEMP01045857.1.p1 GENE.GEMP01045857.1~~GEMP01045857.1.p1  ORF type:complete len:472 (+),score=123.88 GEMP01045857.1:24-1439(+)